MNRRSGFGARKIVRLHDPQVKPASPLKGGGNPAEAKRAARAARSALDEALEYAASGDAARADACLKVVQRELARARELVPEHARGASAALDRMQKAMSLLEGPLAELRQKGPSATVARAVAKAAQEIRARRESGLSRRAANRGARRA